MKPKDLRRPYRWQHRCVLFQDRILYVPDFYDNYEGYQFPAWDSEEVFGNNNPVYVEYCSGNGQWIIDKAIKHPEINWVAVELRFDRVRKIWSKLMNEGLKNLIIVCGEAKLSTHHYFPAGSVSAAFCNFPDPWPKERHAKHRLIQEPFVREVEQTLKPGGSFTLVTDDAPYSEQMMEEIGKVENFASIYGEQGYSTEREDYGTSYFEELWRSKGETIRYHEYRKQALAVEA